MSAFIWELLNNWKQSRNSGGQGANAYLLLILQQVLETKGSMDPSLMDQLRFDLEQSVDGLVPENWDSYNLGLAKALNQMLTHEVTNKHKTYTVETLGPLERKLIQCLAHAPKSTPSQLMGKTEVSNRQQMTNLLRILRAKNLVEYQEIGKYRWYSLNDNGAAAYESLIGKEEQAVARGSSIKEPTMETTVNEFVKRRHKDDGHKNKQEIIGEFQSALEKNRKHSSSSKDQLAGSAKRPGFLITLLKDIKLESIPNYAPAELHPVRREEVHG